VVNVERALVLYPVCELQHSDTRTSVLARAIVLMSLPAVLRRQGAPRGADGSCGVRDLTAGLSRQPGEAEGSLTLELRGRAASGPDNDATCQDCRMARARQARRTVCDASEPVIEPPQAQAPAQTRWIRAGQVVRGNPILSGNPTLGGRVGLPGACGECPRDRLTRPAGEQLGTDPAKRTAVNVGTRPVSPHPACGVGKAQRLLMALGGGIAPVVVAGATTGLGGRESRLQGKGEQWACSLSGTRGGRR
jgi:hypothetical protein